MTPRLLQNVRSAAVAALFGVLAVALAAAYLFCFSPSRPPPRTAAAAGLDTRAMDDALAPAAVSGQVARILACGSRYEGQEGLSAVRARLREAFSNAGFQVYTLTQTVPVPVTLRREILGSDGRPLAGVRIYPFQPNHVQPIATPAGGVTGRLVLASDVLLRTSPRFDDCIAVIDADAPPETYGYNWLSYAQAGFQAVIVASRHGLEGVRWTDVGGLRATAPVNYPRLAADAGLFAHLDQIVTLRVNVTWRPVASETLVAVRPAVRPAREAAVFTAMLDAPSVLPDLAPGTLGAVNLAAQQALLNGLAGSHDDPRRVRDVVFVCYSSFTMGLLAPDALTSTIGTAWKRDDARRCLADELAANAVTAAGVRRALALFDDPRTFDDAAFTVARVASLDASAGKAFSEACDNVAGTVLLELSESQLQARLAFLRTGGQADSPAFAAYREAKERSDAAMGVAALPLRKLLDDPRARAFATGNNLRGRVVARLRELAAFHDARAAELGRALAVHDLLRHYDRLVAMGVLLAPADPARTRGEALSFFMGEDVEKDTLRQAPVIDDILLGVMQRGGLGVDVSYDPLHGRDHNNWAPARIASLPVDVLHWNSKGYPAFVLINTDRTYAYNRAALPVDDGAWHDLDTLRGSLRAYGRVALAMVYGAGAFEPPVRSRLCSYSGRVVASGVGRAVVPTYPLAGALVGHKGNTYQFEQTGYNVHPFLMTDPYGRYACLSTSVPILPAGQAGYSPEAVGFADDGTIRFIKDEGSQGQRLYKSINVGSWGNRQDINIVAFRAAPVALLDTVNPQNLKAYTGFDFLRRDGLVEVPKINTFSRANGVVVVFLEPDCRFFVTLKAGAPENDKVQAIRAFLLGDVTAFHPTVGSEIDGPGYLASDTPRLLDVPRHTTRSMVAVNGLRLDVQRNAGMADVRVQDFHARSLDLAGRAASESSAHAATLDWRAAATYAIMNHPVLRRNVSEAIWGVIWYLGLLVPFAFFFEKLAFGFTDIRHQLAAQAVIFLVVFALLWLLHPAFAMIRSSLMILLGFVIMLIAGGITLLFSGKFKENLESLRRQRGQATAADVNTLGILGTAFALGLNNMHRRLVRTGLTCATLVLLTFAMICFTSVQSDIVDTTVAVGKASYEGLLIKPERFAPITEAELFALRDRYQHVHTLATRGMVVGHQGWDRVNYNPDIEIVYESAGDLPKRRTVSTMLELGPNEPLRRGIRLLTRGGWFTEESIKTEREIPPVLLAAPLAAGLGLRPADVDAGPVVVAINGKHVRVQGIFDADTLANLRDLDGRDLLPFDIEAMRAVQVGRDGVLADENAPRLSADSAVIMPGNLGITGSHGSYRLASVAVCMPGLAYSDARREVDQYLEQSGQATCYGLGGVAYRGRRTRATSFAGLMELLVPLLIAALTVLNTMKGSVYERRDEIFVYNAVGIAPRYIFAMFFSEAFVYAVVGSMLGFLLSQGVGRVLTVLGWTGGLPMTFTSIHTIYASLAIMAAVFLSTFFPALAALRIAAPADETGWRLPEPAGDAMSFALPFTFSARDRVAVLAFFRRHFLDHGEGGGGRFFAGPPCVGLSETGGARVPELVVDVWLKPFDLGVSQRLAIAMPSDPETGEFAARITLTRLSGTRESWLRLNGSFVAALRRHFLYWRAIGPAERRTLFDEARCLIEERAGAVSPVQPALHPEPSTPDAHVLA